MAYDMFDTTVRKRAGEKLCRNSLPPEEPSVSNTSLDCVEPKSQSAYVCSSSSQIYSSLRATVENLAFQTVDSDIRRKELQISY
jgi:hypothetical protein